jgi:tRNA 2-selenouridine synthase
MPIEKLTIEAFLHLSKQHPILDVRSPGEFNHAHIPGAFNLPLFSDEERKVVGTAYKQQGREAAIKIGLDFFGSKMRRMVDEAAAHRGRTFLVHCWRGGMRSAGVSWLLDLYGFKVYQLVGGYKSFRHFVLDLFSGSFSFQILGGFAGSGKTATLKEMQKLGVVLIDLEELANHKGSAFGDLSGKVQCTQEMFENFLAMELHEKRKEECIWMEDESQRIGNLQIPQSLWISMKQSPLVFLQIPFEQRLDRIVKEYGNLDPDYLVNAILRIQKRLGGLETKTAIGYIRENEINQGFSILLKYYDKCYHKALQDRGAGPGPILRLNSAAVEPNLNANKIRSHRMSTTYLSH